MLRAMIVVNDKQKEMCNGADAKVLYFHQGTKRSSTQSIQGSYQAGIAGGVLVKTQSDLDVSSNRIKLLSRRLNWIMFLFYAFLHKFFDNV